MLVDILILILFVFVFIYMMSTLNYIVGMRENPTYSSYYSYMEKQQKKEKKKMPSPSPPSSSPHKEPFAFDPEKHTVIGKIRPPHAGSAGKATHLLLDEEPYLVQN